MWSYHTSPKHKKNNNLVTCSKSTKKNVNVTNVAVVLSMYIFILPALRFITSWLDSNVMTNGIFSGIVAFISTFCMTKVKTIRLKKSCPTVIHPHICSRETQIST